MVGLLLSFARVAHALRYHPGGDGPALVECAYATAMRGVCGTRTAVSVACTRSVPV